MSKKMTGVEEEAFIRHAQLSLFYSTVFFPLEARGEQEH